MPNVAETTSNSTYLPFTRKLVPRLAAGTVVSSSPPRTVPPGSTIEKPPPSHPSEDAAFSGVSSAVNAGATNAPEIASATGTVARIRFDNENTEAIRRIINPPFSFFAIGFSRLVKTLSKRCWYDLHCHLCDRLDYRHLSG